MDENKKNLNITISSGTLLRIILVSGLVFALIKLVDVVLVILTAIVVASFVEYAVKKMKPYIKNRTLSVFTIYALTLGIFVGIFTLFVPVFIHEMSTLVTSLGKYIPNDSILSTFQTDTLSGAQGVVKTISRNASLGEVIKSSQKFVSSLSGGFLNIAGVAFGSILNLFLIGIISFYLSVTEKGIENFLRIIIPADSEEYVISLWQRTEHKIGLWMQGQMLLGLTMGILSYIGLLIMGVKYAFLLALLTAFFELIPFGIILAVIPATLFGYLDGGVTIAFLIMCLYFVLQQLENYVIQPMIMKKVIGISPLVVILSLLIGAQLAGFWGVLLAIPCAVCLLEFLDDVEKKKVMRNA